MRHRCAHLVTLVAALLVGGCRHDVASEFRLACSLDRDCSAGWRCDRAVGQCESGTLAAVPDTSTAVPEAATVSETAAVVPEISTVDHGCERKTCAMLGKTCGIWDDGCGGQTTDCPVCECAGVADCNDSNACTTDACTNTKCVNTAIAGCCTSGSQCDDGKVCTADVCSSNKCVSTTMAGCCTSASQCDDGNTCTTDSCASGQCLHSPAPGCCGDVSCPTLSGYTAGCNAAMACEYTPNDSSGWHVWDVWIYVPPGSFSMGSTAGAPDEKPVHLVTFSKGYFIGKYEIVVAQYEACQTASPCTAPSTADFNGCAETGLNTSANGRGKHPQNGLKWPQAKAFCGWVAPGGRLPSEAEWEYAAAGKTPREYPWGDTPEPTCTNGTAQFAVAGCGCGTNMTAIAGDHANGGSTFGVQDMAGNLSEWVEDCWHASYSGAPVDGSSWTDCSDYSARVIRGGSITGLASDLRIASRSGDAPTNRNADVGGRCVRPLP